MAVKYYQAVNYGKGFITHEDNEYRHVSGYPGDIWVTENEIWAQRIGATELTKEQAQTIVDSEYQQALENYQNSNDPNRPEPTPIILP